MSKEKPIIFSAPMVRAILEGRKSMTRRIVKADWLDDSWWQIQPKDGWHAVFMTEVPYGMERGLVCPYGSPGDRLWVREKFDFSPCGLTGCEIFYWADGSSQKRTPPNDYNPYLYPNERVRPSIHMPRWASRITLEITAIRVERLQEITNQDAQKEGPPWANPHRHGPEGLEFDEHPGKIIRDPYADRHNTGINDCWICAFRMIWSDINGPGSWDLNPWVWVIEFGRIA